MQLLVVAVDLEQLLVCATFHDLSFVEHAYLVSVLIVDRRWAMATVVRVFMSRSSASCTSRSLSVSSADVASSRMRMGGF